MNLNSRLSSTLGPEAFRNLFQQLNQVFIQPEIERRREAGSLAEDFKIKKCMIFLGSLMRPTVLFNEEFGWMAEVEPDFDGEPTVGMDVHYREIKKINSITRPLQDGRPASFAYLSHSLSGYTLLLDIIPEELSPEEDNQRWNEHVAPMVIERITQDITERIIQHYDHTKLRQIGLWLAPSLFPYPLSKILHLLEANDQDSAKMALQASCTNDYVQRLVSDWSTVSAHRTRSALFEAALDAHCRRSFYLSIHALLPQVEGVISDFLYAQLPAADVPFRADSKIKKYKDLLLGALQRHRLYAESIKSSADFMLDVMLQDFKKWFDPVHGGQFPMRHPLMHGRFDDALYSEGNSVKLFLMLDTLHSYMSFYSKLEAPLNG